MKQIIEFVEDADNMRELSKTYIDGLTSVPSTLRNEVWKKYISYTYRKGKCFCCKTSLIEDSNFECGHIISKHNGGPILLKNLRPVCGQCNKSMSVKNMDEFIILCGFWSTLIKKRLNSMTEEERFLIDSKFNRKKCLEEPQPLSQKMTNYDTENDKQPIPHVTPDQKGYEPQKITASYTNLPAHVHIHIDANSSLQPRIIEDKTAPTKQHKICVNLEGYKVSGLKDLCRQYNVSTINCSVREDYVVALKKKGIGK